MYICTLNTYTFVTDVYRLYDVDLNIVNDIY